jgi:hypothetical protein
MTARARPQRNQLAVLRLVPLLKICFDAVICECYDSSPAEDRGTYGPAN